MMWNGVYVQTGEVLKRVNEMEAGRNKDVVAKPKTISSFFLGVEERERKKR